jgi:hypothetical protein
VSEIDEIYFLYALSPKEKSRIQAHTPAMVVRGYFTSDHCFVGADGLRSLKDIAVNLTDAKKLPNLKGEIDEKNDN